ncbi:MAG TPA: FMN-binding protein [Naasia sp.]
MTVPSFPARIPAVALAGFGVLGALAGCAAGGSAAETNGGADGAASGGPYADGTYEAEGEYVSPGGPESIGVSITLEGDVVTDVTVTPHAEEGNAVQYQGQFASGIAAEVVGKDIDELEVSRVAGSSLTSEGFNQAVDAIKADAAAG